MDKVVDDSLKVVQDLVHSNFCEVSEINFQRKTSSLLSMEDIHGSAIPVKCDTHQLNMVDAIMEKEIDHDPMPEKTREEDVEVEESLSSPLLVNNTFVDDGLAPKANPVHVKDIKDSSQVVEENFSCKNTTPKLQIFEKEFLRGIMMGKLLAERVLFEHEIGNCVMNFLEYTDYLMGAFEKIQGLQNNYNLGHRITFKKEIQKQLIVDIESSMKHVKSVKNGYLVDQQTYHCIMCAIVKSKNDLLGVGDGYSTKLDVVNELKCNRKCRTSKVVSDR